MDEIVRVVVGPRVVRAMWFGTKSSIRRSPRCRARARSARQRFAAAKVAVHGGRRDREAGPGDILFAQIGQRLLELVPPRRIAARDALRGRSRLSQTLNNQSQSKPISTRRSSSASVMSSSVAEWPSDRDSSVNRTRVLSWYSEG